MTPEQFTYWLQGFSEISDKTPTENEWKIIQDHLALVFNKITPTYPKIDFPRKMEDPGYPQVFEITC